MKTSEHTVKTSVSITYTAKDGWHVFASDELPGLYVASRDLATAYNDVGRSIEALLMLDEGIACVVEPEVAMDEFLAALRGLPSDNADYMPTVRRFAVYGACA